MFIVHVAAELAPIAKVGGLGDVVYGLSKEHLRNGHQVEIILPKYDCIHCEFLHELKIEIPDLKISSGNVAIWSADLAGLRIKLVESLAGGKCFSREKIYGFSDDVERFLLLSESALVYLSQIKQLPDVIHVHDWHTAILPALQKKEKKLKEIKSVLTLHNLQHQGICDPALLKKLKYESPQPANLLKMGIISADAVTTVSPSYEKEIKTPLGGFGLEETLLKNQNKLTGILNGIDAEIWNPEKDPMLFQRYTSASIESTLNGKAANREHLRQLLGLEKSAQPLVACITRLVSQKGPELIKYSLLKTLTKGAQFVLLGAAGPKEIFNDFQDLKSKLSKNQNCSIQFDQNEALAHLIYAAADLFIIPSLFEPCGLTQLIAMRYGTIPVARKTGGLADTVFDIDTSNTPFNERNGFTFDFPDNAGIDWALDRALNCYANDREKWQKLIAQATAHDFTWKQSAEAYLKIYSKTRDIR